MVDLGPWRVCKPKAICANGKEFAVVITYVIVPSPAIAGDVQFMPLLVEYFHASVPSEFIA